VNISYKIQLILRWIDSGAKAIFEDYAYARKELAEYQCKAREQIHRRTRLDFHDFMNYLKNSGVLYGIRLDDVECPSGKETLDWVFWIQPTAAIEIIQGMITLDNEGDLMIVFADVTPWRVPFGIEKEWFSFDGPLAQRARIRKNACPF
jgi:hypothetical protein